MQIHLREISGSLNNWEKLFWCREGITVAHRDLVHIPVIDHHARCPILLRREQDRRPEPRSAPLDEPLVLHLPDCLLPHLQLHRSALVWSSVRCLIGGLEFNVVCEAAIRWQTRRQLLREDVREFLQQSVHHSLLFRRPLLLLLHPRCSSPLLAFLGQPGVPWPAARTRTSPPLPPPSPPPRC